MASASAPETGPGAGQAPKKSEEVNITPSDEFTLDGYLSAYTGHTRIERLLFIAQRSRKFRVSALKLAMDELKRTNNTITYRKINEKFAEDIGSYFDSAWADSVDKKCQQTLERLEMELNGHKTNLIKESIRAGHNELGDFYFGRGDLNAGLRSYLRLRDYCATSQHVIDMCMNVINVSIQTQNFAHVINYVSKAEQTPELSDKLTINKLKVAAALAHLDSRKYKQAAKKFLELNFNSIAGKYPEVISTQDIAIYTALAALAEFERSEIKSKLIDNSDFKNFLETVPDVRDVINDFYDSRYGRCLGLLDKIKSDLLLDIHLHDHVNALYIKIRNKAIVQYFSPFMSVDLALMATAFNTDIQSLEKELANLIVENVIQARIDSHNKRLYARQSDARNTTFEKVISLGDNFHRDSKAMLLRVNMIRNDFTVKPSRGGGGGGGGSAQPGPDKSDRKMQ